MTDPDAVAPDRDEEVGILLPDLPTAVGMPGHTIEREVGGHVCLNTGVIGFPPAG